MKPSEPTRLTPLLALALLAIVVLFLGSMVLFVKKNADPTVAASEEHPLHAYNLHYPGLVAADNTLFVALRMNGAEPAPNARPDIYQADFMNALRVVTDEVFFLPGIDRESVRALHTRYTQTDVTTGQGIPGSNAVPLDFAPSAEMFELIRQNVDRLELVGTLVAKDQRGALISGRFITTDPRTGEKLDTKDVAKRLADICAKFDSPDIGITAVMALRGSYWLIDGNGVRKTGGGLGF